MTKIIQKMGLMSLAFLPVLAMAHPGHDQTHTGFMAGFIHPFTGLDHMMMALALGVLLSSVAKQWKAVGFIAIATALVVGFVIGAQHFIPEQYAEYGIVLSLLVVATALWKKSTRILPIATAMLVTFHGVAHGAELGHSGHVATLILGMIAAMSMIYFIGLALGAFIKKYVPHGQKIVASIAAIVAVIGLV